MNIKKALYTEIENEFEDLSKLDVGSDTHKTSVDELVKLLDRAIEIEKHEDEMKEREAERLAKLDQVAEEQRNRKAQNAIQSAGIILPLMVTIWGTVKSFEFEREGTITTIMGRGFINKLLPKK